MIGIKANPELERDEDPTREAKKEEAAPMTAEVAVTSNAATANRAAQARAERGAIDAVGRYLGDDAAQKLGHDDVAAIGRGLCALEAQLGREQLAYLLTAAERIDKDVLKDGDVDRLIAEVLRSPPASSEAGANAMEELRLIGDRFGTGGGAYGDLVRDLFMGLLRYAAVDLRDDPEILGDLLPAVMRLGQGADIGADREAAKTLVTEVAAVLGVIHAPRLFSLLLYTCDDPALAVFEGMRGYLNGPQA